MEESRREQMAGVGHGGRADRSGAEARGGRGRGRGDGDGGAFGRGRGRAAGSEEIGAVGSSRGSGRGGFARGGAAREAGTSDRALSQAEGALSQEERDRRLAEELQRQMDLEARGGGGETRGRRQC